MQQLQLESGLNPDKSMLHFDNLRSFLSYLEYLSDTHLRSGVVADFDSSLLKKCHSGNSVLLVDKYVNCAVPSVDLEFILESQGIQDYEAYLDPDFNFKHSICKKGDTLSEVFSANISGDHFNPYIRFKACVGNGSRCCSKLLDLAGLDIVDLNIPNVHDNIFLDLVCTFPEVVDFYFFNPSCRARASHRSSGSGKVHKSRLDIKQTNFIDRMNRCRESFFKQLHALLLVPSGNVLGCSSSLHVWSSEVPVLPNCHVHNLIPFFSYTKKPVYDNSDLLQILQQLKDPEVVVAVDVAGSVKHGSVKSFGSMDNVIHFSNEVRLCQRFIVDQGLYDQLRLELSAALARKLHMVPVDWSDPKYPVDIDRLKGLWSDIVYNEFGDIMDCYELLDIHVQWIPSYNKSQLLHALQYKTRPPVLDLDLFFKKCSGVVTGYNDIDIGKISDYLDYQLQIAINCSNYPDICRYESLIAKFRNLSESHGPGDFLDWLRFLSVWVTDTRVFGFWRNIKRYMLDPDHKFLVEQVVCPICNGSICDTGITVRSCAVDYVVIRSRSKFLVCNVKDPPPIPIMSLENGPSAGVVNCE